MRPSRLVGVVASLALLAAACTFTIERNINAVRTTNALNELGASIYLDGRAAVQAAKGCVAGVPVPSSDLVADYGGEGGAAFAELAGTADKYDYPRANLDLSDGDATLAIWQQWTSDPVRLAVMLDPRWDSIGVGQGTCSSGDIYITAVLRDDAGPMDLVQQDTVSAFGQTFESDFYRNNTYECGLSGNYTFLVVNPTVNPDGEAPLWVYLHGGGVGYYDEVGTYHAVKTQTEDTYNHEETFADLWNKEVVNQIVAGNGQPADQTVKRRIDEGYRVLVVSMCDHDLYSGQGTPYTNHPTNPNAEVNGLQATMAAIDYTAANYPTTHVWAHGTSAGSLGVWALASTYAQQGNPLTGIVADSWIATPRILTTAAAFSGLPGYPFGSDFDITGVTDKIGHFADPNIPAYPGAEIGNDWRGVPSLFIGGNNDPFCGGNQAPLAEAVAAGLSNCNWLHDGLRQAIDAQVDTPHQLHVLDGFGHVPTNNEGPVNDIVDDFISDLLATNPPPFGSD